MIAAAVVAHPKRIEWAEALAAEVGATIVLDTDGIGAGANHRRALTQGLATGASHVLALEDDALPVPDLMTHVTAAIEQRPEQILGLYVGRQRPLAKAVTTAVMQAEMLGASWLTHPGLLWGVATVWPTALANTWLAERERGVWDQQARRWCKTEGHEVAYCYPSLVDHRDKHPVVSDRGPRQRGRVAHRVGVPDWNSLTVRVA